MMLPKLSSSQAGSHALEFQQASCAIGMEPTFARTHLIEN